MIATTSDSDGIIDITNGTLAVTNANGLGTVAGRTDIQNGAPDLRNVTLLLMNLLTKQEVLCKPALVQATQLLEHSHLLTPAPEQLMSPVLS